MPCWQVKHPRVLLVFAAMGLPLVSFAGLAQGAEGRSVIFTYHQDGSNGTFNPSYRPPDAPMSNSLPNHMTDQQTTAVSQAAPPPPQLWTSATRGAVFSHSAEGSGLRVAEGTAVTEYSLNDLVEIGRQRSPELRQAALRVEAASGRAIQAGLYPNPTIAAEGTELGNRNGPGGFIAAPVVSQEVVVGGKLRLNREIGRHDTNQARWECLQAHWAWLTAVRRAYFETAAAQKRLEIYSELAALAGRTAETTETLVKARQAAPLDLLQMRVEMNRLQAEVDAAEQERRAAWRQLAATIGVPHLAEGHVRSLLEEPLPVYDFETASQRLVESHPRLLAARAGASKAQVALRRAQVEPIPNINFGAGYERDHVDHQDQWLFRASMPLPVFNRNQGQIQAASAELGQATAELDRVRNALIAELATAFGQYAAASERARRYRDTILPDAQEAYRLSLNAFQGGQFDYLRVLQAQRSIAETRWEYVRALTSAWLAAADIAGLLQEDDWPR